MWWVIFSWVVGFHTFHFFFFIFWILIEVWLDWPHLFFVNMFAFPPLIFSVDTFCLLPYPSPLIARLWDVAVRTYSSLVTVFLLCTWSKKRATSFTSFYYPSLLRHVISHISVPFYLDWLLVLFIFIILSHLYWWVVSTMDFQCWLVFHLPLQWFILHALHSAYFPTVHISLPNFDLGLHIQV